MYSCNNILSKLLDTSFVMESPLPDEEIDADGEFKNVKVRKKKEPLNYSIQRIFATKTPTLESIKGILKNLTIC
jgi:hypothetical protein